MRAINIFLKILPNFFGLLAIVWCMENNVVSNSSLDATTNISKKLLNVISTFLPFQDCGKKISLCEFFNVIKKRAYALTSITSVITIYYLHVSKDY